MTSPTTPATVPALILAGSRPGPDPLLSGTNVSTKALLPIAGVPMLVHVVRALRATPRIGSITILAQNSAELAQEPLLQGIEGLIYEDSGQGISSSLSAALPAGEQPMLITTADNVLLTPQMVEEFLDGAVGSDVSVAMVEREILLARYPESRRTWLKFRSGWWSGANLFWMRGQKAQPLLQFWSGIEKDRKKGLKIIAAFGPVLMLGAVLRLFTIQQGVAKAGQRFGITSRVVPMSAAEACIDADKPDDIILIEKIMAARDAG
jgi:GTP:adenosylcobinamide-phosphate guanylyltransferase